MQRNRKPNRQTGIQRKTDRHAHRKAGRQTDRHADIQTGIHRNKKSTDGQRLSNYYLF